MSSVNAPCAYWDSSFYSHFPVASQTADGNLDESRNSFPSVFDLAVLPSLIPYSLPWHLPEQTDRQMATYIKKWPLGSDSSALSLSKERVEKSYCMAF